VADLLALGVDETKTAKVVSRRLEASHLEESLMSGSRALVGSFEDRGGRARGGRGGRAARGRPRTLGATPAAVAPAEDAQALDKEVLMAKLRALGDASGTGWRALAREAPKVLWPASAEFTVMHGAEPRRTPLVSNHGCESRQLRATPVTDEQALTTLATAPLARFAPLIESAPKMANVCATVGFDVSSHPVAGSKIARDMQQRLALDAAHHAETANGTMERWLRFLPPSSDLLHAPLRATVSTQLRGLIEALESQRDEDKATMHSLLAATIETANLVALDGELASDERHAREQFALEQLAASSRAPIAKGFLLSAIVSSCAAADLSAINPYAPHELLLDNGVAVLMVSTRIGALNRCVSCARELIGALEDAATEDEALGSIAGKANALVSAMLSRRHYFAEDATTPTPTLIFDPRFAVFEFTQGLLLRASQVALCREFLSSVRSGTPLVKQMIMGGGKTTVVAPMLALMLGDGERLVVITMPLALLEQSKATLRSAFATVLKKRVSTLVVERSSVIDWSTVDKLTQTKRQRGMLLCTAQSLKSLQLKLLENMVLLGDERTRKQQQPATEHHVRALVAAVCIFQQGTLIMDEVDLILHPLKSELNFPIGEKHALPVSPERWNLAIHATDAVFVAASGTLPPSLQQSARARDVAAALREVIAAGYERRALQRSPHLVLLDLHWYKDEMRPVLAQWMLLYLEQSHVGAITSQEQLAYLLDDADALDGVVWSAGVESAGAERDRECAAQGIRGPGATLNRLHIHMEASLDAKSFQLLNLCRCVAVRIYLPLPHTSADGGHACSHRDWLLIYLPHALQKINRVSFGLRERTAHCLSLSRALAGTD
jgi:hypothetical protein